VGFKFGIQINFVSGVEKLRLRLGIGAGDEREEGRQGKSWITPLTKRNFEGDRRCDEFSEGQRARRCIHNCQRLGMLCKDLNSNQIGKPFENSGEVTPISSVFSFKREES